MAEIRYLANRDLYKDESFERIVAAARANAGLWLMIKERVVERRAIKAELLRRGGVDDIDQQFPTDLTPMIAELAEGLVSAIFGGCPPEIRSRAQVALIEAAESELDGDSAHPSRGARVPPKLSPSGGSSTRRSAASFSGLLTCRRPTPAAAAQYFRNSVR